MVAPNDDRLREKTSYWGDHISKSEKSVNIWITGLSSIITVPSMLTSDSAKITKMCQRDITAMIHSYLVRHETQNAWR